MSVRTNSDRVRVLVTAAGGGGTIEIIKSLRSNGYYVTAVDASEYAAGFHFADAAYVVPEAIRPEFPRAMSQILKNDGPDFVVPLVDEEIPVFHELLEAQPSRSFRLLTPTKRFCNITLDKWQTFLSLRDAGLPTPATMLAGPSSNIQWPAVIKPRDGRGSRGVACLDGPQDLAVYLNGSKRPPDDFVLQQRVEGSEFTVSVVVALGGPVMAVVPKEVVVKRGVTMVGVTRIQPAIDALCRSIQDALRADGPFNVQLIVDRDGIPQIIEINPRYSTTVALTIASGIDEVHLVIQQALGRPVETPKFQPDLMMLRYYTQQYFSEEEWSAAHGRHAHISN